MTDRRDHAIDHLSVWAVRYALGRATYAVGDVVDALIEHRAALRLGSRTAIIRAIDDAEAREDMGMAVDAAAWRRLRDALGGSARAPLIRELTAMFELAIPGARVVGVPGPGSLRRALATNLPLGDLRTIIAADLPTWPPTPEQLERLRQALHLLTVAPVPDVPAVFAVATFPVTVEPIEQGVQTFTLMLRDGAHRWDR